MDVYYVIYSILQASLYSVRWYFESEEFYRYVPKEAPPARTFPVSGITVDVSLFIFSFFYSSSLKAFKFYVFTFFFILLQHKIYF